MQRRDLEAAVVVVASLLIALPFLGKAFHVDEPFFLDRARELASGTNWVPRAWSDFNNNPPAILWLLAAATRLSGESEALLRALLLPLDALAAASLYFLFARFLKRPLPWALLAVLSPAYVLNMGHAMAEKPAMAFGAAALCALVKGAEERRPRWLAVSALLLSAAMMSKYAAVALLPAAGWYLLQRGFGPRRVAGYLMAAALAPALYVLSDASILSAVATTTSGAAAGGWARGSHRARSILAFLGGLSVFPALWPRWTSGRTALAVAAASALLFSPFLDSAPVRAADRMLGIWLAAGAAAALIAACAAKRAEGRDLWLPWLLASTLLAAVYWSVMARVVLFAIPPLALALGAVSESRDGKARVDKTAWAAVCAAALLSLSLGRVDFRYAGSQKDLALELASAPAGGREIWCAARLGLRHYLLRAGARPLDSEADWKGVRPGDTAVFAKTTTNFRPAHPRRASVERREVSCLIPLRLISGFGGEGGFYSNISGFLPFSISAEPVEEFTLVQPL